MWQYFIKTANTGTYIINIRGIKTGTSCFDARGRFPGARADLEKVFVLIEAATTRQLSVEYSVSTGSIKVKRIVTPGDLLKDVKIACQLNLINGRACRRLEEKARVIEKALADQNEKQAEQLLESFLHALGHNRPQGCKEDDEHAFVKEPALTILKEDAQVLLENPGPDNNHNHRKPHHHGRK